MTIGTFVGSLMVGPFSSYLGRKYGLWGATILNFVATSVMLGTTSVGALYAARLVLGISVGWFLTFSQLYVHEVAPAHLRGITFAVYQAQLSIGSIVGAATDYGTAGFLNKNAYRIPLAVFFVAPTIQSICLFFFPETPRWLMTKGKEEAAERSLRQLRNSNIAEHEFQAEFNEIRGSTREQVEQNKKALFIEMWRGSNLRRTGLSVAVICFHAANGKTPLHPYPRHSY
jgi:MFS family permease